MAPRNQIIENERIFSSDPFTSDCPGREIFIHVTSRWALLILASLSVGPMRFHMLRDRVDGISEKMLSQTLKTLCRDGLIDRTVEPTVPPQVTYELTQIGLELAGLLRELSSGWGDVCPTSSPPSLTTIR
ncbi:helix-turn-helix domain-containing protein [Devosia sp. Root436]|uniref:winged helix-turn-helix transcriptional regulator n=1 Tax=Devosia sp. Root436 TaxID=1736537 RepID=UPI00190FD625|nr:helix-turn-helix domain-containing protein [Devosia sp. Root436]